MKLTPLDIRKQEFARRVRGVDADEVSAFLQTVSMQWDELLSEHRGLEQKIREMETKLQHYVNVEEALQEALRSTRESAKQTLESAKQQAEGIVAAARQQADDVRRAAEQERADLRREATEVQSRRDEIVARLRAFLNSEMELLLRFESDRVGAPSTAPQPTMGAAATQPAAGNGALQNAPPAPTRPVTSEEVVRPEAAQPIRPAIPAPAPSPAAPPTAAPPPSQAERDDARFGSGWVVHPVIGSGQRTPQQPEEPPAPAALGENDRFGISASADELERIRQILKDLD